MSVHAAPALISSIPRAVDVSAIERELAQLWGQPQRSGDTEDAVTRACMSNLVIFCAAREQAGIVSQEVGHIVLRHPSRVLLLVTDASQTVSDIEAFVSAQCHLTGAGKQVCSEHVMVTAGGPEAERRLTSVVRPLLIGDLPTALWWTAQQAPTLEGELFQALAGMADQVIYDSADWPDAARGVVATADWVARLQADLAVADLAWRRLKPWRRLIAQVLDPAVVPGALDAITEVVIEHGPHGLPQAWLLIGWLACRLDWRPAAVAVEPGAEVGWTFQSVQGPLRVTLRRLTEGEPQVHNVSVCWKVGAQSSRVTFQMRGAERLTVTAAGAGTPLRALAIPAQTRAALVARQLPDLARDAVFRDTLRVARTMAASLL